MKSGTQPGYNATKKAAAPVRGAAALRVFRVRPERNPEAQLDVARTGAAGALIGDQAGQCAGDAAEIRAAHRGVGVGERRRVGEVGALGAELGAELLGDPEFAEQREVEVAEAGTGDVIVAEVAPVGGLAVGVERLGELPRCRTKVGPRGPRDRYEAP